MKKLLSILAAVGLTATASTSVVACTTTIKGDKVKIEDGKIDDTLLTKSGITADSNNYYVSFTKKTKFNKHTNYYEIKDGDNVIGYRLIPYKLHLVANTASNLATDSHPSDMFSWGGNDGKGGTDVSTGNEGSLKATAYVTTSNTKWFNTDKKRPTAWPLPDHKYDTGKKDKDGKAVMGDLNVDGIVRNDITVKATFTIVIPKSSVTAGQEIKVALIRIEADGGSSDIGRYNGEHDANIDIKIPSGN